MSKKRANPAGHPPKGAWKKRSLHLIWKHGGVALCHAVSRGKATPYGMAFPRWPRLSLLQISYAYLLGRLRVGGAYRDRTDDLMLAKQPLSQLS